MMKLKGRIKQLKADLRQMKKTCRILMKAKAEYEEKVSKVFGQDLLPALTRGGMS